MIIKPYVTSLYSYAFVLYHYFCLQKFCVQTYAPHYSLGVV